MYSFLTGPMLVVSILLFVIGLAYKVVKYVRGLDWRLERVAYRYGGKKAVIGAVSSALKWLIPFGTHSWRKQPFLTFAFFFFHLGVVICPLFLAGHMLIMKSLLGFSLPAMPMWLSDTCTVLGILGGIMMVLRRVSLPEVRFITNRTDWTVLLLTLFVLVAGFFARMQVPGYECWLLLHIFAAELILIMAPFTKLSHIVLYFMSRGQLGMDFAIKRGGARRGPVFPW